MLILVLHTIVSIYDNKIFGEFLDVAREWAGRVKRNCIGGEFRKAKYEIRRWRKSEGGQKFLPPNPLPFCSPEPKRSPAALLVQSRTPKKSFVFLLEEKIGRAQIKKCEENFFAGWRALASGGEAARQSFPKTAKVAIGGPSENRTRVSAMRMRRITTILQAHFTKNLIG